MKPIKRSGQSVKKDPQKTKKPRWKRVLLITGSVVGFIILCVVIMGWIYQFKNRNDPNQFGVSFTPSAATDLGVNWQENFTALLDDAGFRSFRLTSYWEEIEPTPGAYNFSQLDWQMDEVAKRSGTVTLSIGLRQPRWPECHMPGWAREKKPAKRLPYLETFITQVVERYRNHPALKSWHLENEYFNRNFGECDDYSRDRLAREVSLVKRLDSKHPVVLALADQLGLPLRTPVPDIYATSLYRGNYVKYIGYFPYPITTHYYSAKSLFIEFLHGKETYIHELQLEPWGPRATKYLTIEEQNHYMGVTRLQKNIRFAKRTGMKEMYWWGGEWWYWRKTALKDPSVWEVIKTELKKP